jgi:alkanesulfonate monooxygenase SsuD/methylene tetrahydromethanopterin reductase-like flavin-dependent oxidoreductase (luciferase family)
VGRLADGWLGSLLTPAEARAAVATINAAADQAGREVEQDHFGTSLAIAFGGIPDALAASIRRRRPDADPASLVADGWAGARQMISALVEAGLSKFVVRPATQAASIEDFVAGFARELMPMQT